MRVIKGGRVVAVVALGLLGVAGCAGENGKMQGGAVVRRVGAEAYDAWMRGCLQGLEKDLPSIGDSAEGAATGYVKEGWEIGVYADRDIVGEFNGRAGGMMHTSTMKAMAEPGWKGVVLFFPREDFLAEDLGTADRFVREGKLVVGFGGAAVREAGRKAGVEWASFVETHAAEHGGLFAWKGGWAVPTDPPADIAALWTWTGEFVGALTRLGKMPPMYESISVPGSEERNKGRGKLKFEEGVPGKVAKGALGRAYLEALKGELSLVYGKEVEKMKKVAGEAEAARRGGHVAHVFAHGHALDEDLGIAHDPGLLHQVNKGLFGLKADAGIVPGDFVFCVGYDRIFEGWYFHDDLTRMRKAGATFAWSMTDYNKDAEFGPAAVPAGEVVVWQHWPLGDAVVAVPGYDIRILPPSGVIGEGVLWMVESEMLGMEEGK